ncbi:MAG: hypothetical protein QOD75_2741, partial [Blastocatellia bacterium]|nr:hypothetical protein [Blastocatellia bacterium]
CQDLLPFGKDAGLGFAQKPRLVEANECQCQGLR